MSISVCIPVGPYPSNKRWLQECLDSVIAQSIPPNEIILIDDGAQLDKLDWLGVWPSEYSQWSVTHTEYGEDETGCYPTIYKMPWRTGVSHAFNYGIALSTEPCVFMLGSDDTLEPECLEKCLQAWLKMDKKDGYYSVPIQYMNDPLGIQTAPCNAAMITKGFFHRTGGFPIQTAIGRGDSALLSICLKHNLPVYWVGHITGQDDKPLYNYRVHEGFWTAQAGRYHDELISIVNKLTEDYQDYPTWTEHYK